MSDALKEIVESIDIIAEEKFKKSTQIYYGLVESVFDKKCVININGKSYTLPFYGGIVSQNKTYAIAVPQNNINQAFVIGELGPDGNIVPISNGGTGASTAAGARTNLGITPANIGAVAKDGDTMTGNLDVSRAGETFVRVNNTNTGITFSMTTGSSSNHGIISRGYYDGTFHSDNKWMIYRNSSGDVIVNGNAENVTGTVAIAHGGTGATTATGACANIGAFDLGVTANAIASGDNLNDYKTVGTYICATNAIANNLNQYGNCPTAMAFKMIVMYSISNTYLLQIIYDYRGEAMWQRWYNSSWSAWCKYSCDVASSDTVNTTYGGVTETGGCVVRKRGNVVQCGISHGNGTTFSGLTGIDSICTIPSGYKPTATIILSIVARDNGVWASANYVTAILRVTSSGAAEIRYNKNVMGTMKYITGTVTWLTDG